jgi:putative phosphoribosyl transferase
MNSLFKNRTDAAKKLVALLTEYKNQDAIVLAIPRGGVPIGHMIAKELNIPLDIALSKKIGHPLHSEFAIGAVSQNESIINPEINVPQEYIDAEIKKLREFLKERYKLLKGNIDFPDLKNKIVIITDDGIATGNTMLVTVKMIQKQQPAKIIVATPVMSPRAVEILRDEVDDIVAVAVPEYFRGVGQFYHDFYQVSDEEVIAILHPKGLPQF